MRRREYVHDGEVCETASVASVGARTSVGGEDADAGSGSGVTTMMMMTNVGTTLVFGRRGGAWSASTTTTGNACGTTTTTMEEDEDEGDDEESVESGFVLRFDVNVGFDARVETRVVRSDDRERFSREVHVGSLRDASADATVNATSGRMYGTVWVPRQTRSAAFDRAMATANAGEDLWDDASATTETSEIGWHESVVFVVESEDAGGEEVRGTIYELSVEYVRGEDYSGVGASEVESNWTSAFDARAEEERIVYERAVETLAEALRETIPVVVDGEDAIGGKSGDVMVDPSSAPFAVVWSLLGAFFAAAAAAVYLWRVRARRAVVLDDAKRETATTNDGDAKKPGVAFARKSSKTSIEKFVTTGTNGSLRHRVASSTPIFAHTTALSRASRNITRVDSLGFVRSALVSGDNSLVVDDDEDDDDGDGDVVLDVNRTQDSEEFHQHALDIRDRSKDASVSEDDSTFDADTSGQFLSAIYEDEIVDVTIGNLLDEVAKIHAEVAIASMSAEDKLDAKRGDFTLIDADEFGRYMHIFEKLGGGASSSVYSAQWHTRLVALKMLHSTEDGGSAMLSEIEIMRSIDHPSIVKIYGACMEPTCLILQIINGGSLHEILHCSPAAADVRLEEKQAIRIARDVASAMTYLHELKPKKIVHRDLKPQNILIEAPSMRAFLADFGVSRVITTSLRTTTTIGAGTVNYMAPELFGDGSVDEKVDVYSFAMIFCEMLTGQVPWKGIHPVRIAALTVDDETGETRPTLPESVSDSTKALIRQCWTYNSRLRPSFRDILSKLERLAS